VILFVRGYELYDWQCILFAGMGGNFLCRGLQEKKTVDLLFGAASLLMAFLNLGLFFAHLFY